MRCARRTSSSSPWMATSPPDPPRLCSMVSAPPQRAVTLSPTDSSGVPTVGSTAASASRVRRGSMSRACPRKSAYPPLAASGAIIRSPRSSSRIATVPPTRGDRIGPRTTSYSSLIPSSVMAGRASTARTSSACTARILILTSTSSSTSRPTTITGTRARSGMTPTAVAAARTA